MGLWTVLKRALSLRCATCGMGRLFRSFLDVHSMCPDCGLDFMPEQGYYVGAMYVNYGVTTCIGLSLSLLALPYLPETTVVVAAITFALTFSIWFHRYARSLWLAMDTYIVSQTAKSSL